MTELTAVEIQEDEYVSYIEAAELDNVKGNKLYRDGYFELAVEAYTFAVGKAAAAGTAGAMVRSKYYANRAQARLQLRDYEGASRDCGESAREGPFNTKAFVRWGLCAEALDRWDEALDHFERGCSLAQPGTALLKTAIEGAHRARANGNADKKVAHEEAMPQELVHSGQMLRLSFREDLPLQCSPGNWFSVSIGLSNEFGLWRRSDFRVAANEVCEREFKVMAPLPSAPGGNGSQVATAAAATAKSTPKLPSGTRRARARLKLIVEARSLEEFGGRARDSIASRCQGLEPGSSGCLDGTAGVCETHRRHSSPELGWIADTDGDPSIGPEGKSTFSVRFRVPRPSSPLLDDCQSLCGGGGNSAGSALRKEGEIGDGACGKQAGTSAEQAPNSPPLSLRRWPQLRSSLLLLRVSVDEAEAESLLGRGVIPVLSLPVTIRCGYPDSHGPLGGSPTMMMGQSEGSALAADALSAGAVNCRETAIPVVMPTVAPGAARCSSGGHVEGRNGADCCLLANGTSSGDGRGCSDDAFMALEKMILVAESPGQLGIGGKVWDSAFVLCEYLAYTRAASAVAASGPHPHECSTSPSSEDQALVACHASTEDSSAGEGQAGLVEGRRVLELGAGTGLVSLCCALLGASAVLATDFEEVTRLIRLNVALNFSYGQYSASAMPPPLPPEGSSAAVSPHKNVSSTEKPTIYGHQSSTAANGLHAELTTPPAGSALTHVPSPSGGQGSRSNALVAAVPLEWGKSSAKVAAFDPEVVVMSDVVYDPAGYEPLLETLLDVLRPGMIAVMAHRHRHPEDGAFFRRLKNLFVVHEQKPTRPVPSASKIAENTAPSSTESAPIAYMGADDSCLVATLVSPQGCERARGRRLDSMTPSTIAAGLELQAGSHGGGTEGGGGPNGRALGGTDVKVFLIWPR